MQLLPAALTPRTAPGRTWNLHRALIGAMARVVACAAVTAAVAASGCATVAETMVTPNDEYLAYRRVRTQREMEPRLAASWAYLQQYPRGQWTGELRPWFLRAELRFFEQRRESAAGLAAYLRTLPDGPHAEEARTALAVYRARARQDHAEQLGLEARLTESRLAALALERERARDTVPTWLGRLLAIDTWGERTSHLDDELIYAWRIDPPGARCQDDVCTRSETLRFNLPGGGDDASRVMVMDVALVLENGGVAEARLQGPGLFSRIYEASTSRRMAHDAPSARVDAIAFTVEVVRGAAESRMPSSRCATNPVAPIVLSLACDGWSLQMRAADAPEQDDDIVIRGPKKP